MRQAEGAWPPNPDPPGKSQINVAVPHYLQDRGNINTCSGIKADAGPYRCRNTNKTEDFWIIIKKKLPTGTTAEEYGAAEVRLVVETE